MEGTVQDGILADRSGRILSDASTGWRRSAGLSDVAVSDLALNHKST